LGLLKVFGALLSFSLSFVSFGAPILWKNETVQVRVPKDSVVTIELPCKAKSVFVNDKASADLSGNGVFVSVGSSPTSVGISCVKGDVYRNYSFYLFPSSGRGHVYLKVIDPELERRYKEALLSKVEPASVRGNSLFERAEHLLKAMVKGKVPSGFEVVKDEKSYKKGDLLIKHQKLWIGRDMVGVLFKLRNLSLMQKRLTTDNLMGKGTVLVWLEKEGWLMPEEEVSGIVIKVRGVKKEGVHFDEVIPYR